MVDIKALESNFGSKHDSKPIIIAVDKGKWIIDVEVSATIATTNIHPDDPEESEEDEFLFHSKMWVKGTPLNFIVDSGIQKKMIST